MGCTALVMITFALGFYPGTCPDLNNGRLSFGKGTPGISKESGAQTLQFDESFALRI